MRATKIVSAIFRTIIWIVLAVVLLATGVILAVYSPWGQNIVKEALIKKFASEEGSSLDVADFRLKFPLDVALSGVTLVQKGDTMVMADTLNASVRMLPLLAGRVSVSEATLINGFYQMGAPDSAMWLRIRAGQVVLKPATVHLSNMGIDLEDGVLRHASVDLLLNPTPPTKSDSTAKTTMTINIDHLVTDDLTYRMRMLPTIDSLGTNIPHGVLQKGKIDLGAQTVALHNFITDSLTAAYIVPDSATVAATPVYPPDTTSTTAPWTITIDTIRISGGEALYTTRGVKPLPGLDFAYIQASPLDLTITDFYNQATDLSLPLKMHATERCGITLDASGTFAIDTTAMYFRNFEVTTPVTDIKADGILGVGDLFTDPWLPLGLTADGYCGNADLQMMFPDFSPYLKLLPNTEPLLLTLDVKGTSSSLEVGDMSVRLPGCATLKADGIVRNAFDPDNIGGDLRLSGHIINVKSIIKGLAAMDMDLMVPPMTLDGHVHILSGVMGGKLTATTLGGRVALDADFNSNTQGYALALKADKFPVHAFLPTMGIGNATLTADVKGKGLDMFSEKTQVDASVHVASLVYEGYDYHDISLQAHVADGKAKINAGVDNDDIDVEIAASGNLDGDTYTWTADADCRHIDMEALHLSQTPMFITGEIEADASFTPKTGKIDASVYVPNVFYKGDEDDEISITNVSAKFLAEDTITRMSVHNRDLTATVVSQMALDSITVRLDRAMAIIDQQIEGRKVNVDTLQKTLPPFEINVIAGSDNLINDILRPQQMSIQHLTLAAHNDSTIFLNSDILECVSGTIKLDTISVDLTQQAEKMHILATVNEVPGNMDNFAHIRLDGLLNTDRISMRVIQQNVEMKTGFDLGAIAVVADSTVTARLFPLSPIIGYKKWSVNLDNYIYYNFFNHHVDANLKMKGDDSSIALYTAHHHELGHEDIDEINDITLNISDIHLADWIAFNPFAPPISGDLSAQMDVRWDGNMEINGDGQVSLSNFYYDRNKVGDFLVDMDVATSLSGTISAKASLDIDGKRTLTLAGNLNEQNVTDADENAAPAQKSPFNLDLSMIEFPLKIANPFLPEDVAQLSGTLNGKMAVSGSASAPLLNGEIYFDQAKVKAAITNTAYTFSTVKIPVVDNVVKFSDFSIMGVNENPLYINGTVDLHSLVDPKISLALKASNMMVVNSQKAAHNALVYGKAYMSLDASVRGNMRFMAVDAKVDVLSGTNVSYVLSESSSELATAGNNDMVKFVNLNDTTAVAAADSLNTESMLLMLDAQLNIQQGTQVTVDLFTGQRDKVQLSPTGYLTYTQSPLSDARVTGRININSGMVRYTLPVIGAEKVFDFSPDSYVVFNGDMLNPVLNIHATDETKVSVTQSGQNSRLVNFDIKVGVTGTLEQMDVAFDLSTDDDITVANELQSMSPEQRANQAMNMLLYNMYTGPGSTASVNLTANPLFSFLESQINNWAADNIKGVDLSFGINQFDQTVNGATSSAMSYSYQVSKSLFDDRFKIMVGGNYTTDADADENLAENLINDISFEYFLNKQQTMALKLFRHVGYVSILEGEITQTGVGFVYRRKLDRLVNMLPKFMRPKEKGQK